MSNRPSVLYHTTNKPTSLSLHDSNLLIEKHHENWLNINVWSVFIDACFHDSLNIRLERSETSSSSTAERKNRDRTHHDNRQKMGRRMDGIFRQRSCQSRREFGCIETAACSAGGATSTKWLSDTRKLHSALRDMMATAQGYINRDPVSSRALRVVGIISAGLSMRLSVLSNPAGQICVVKSEPIRQVPDYFNIQRVLEVILQVVSMKVGLFASYQPHSY